MSKFQILARTYMAVVRREMWWTGRSDGLVSLHSSYGVLSRSIRCRVGRSYMVRSRGSREWLNASYLLHCNLLYSECFCSEVEKNLRGEHPALVTLTGKRSRRVACLMNVDID